MSGQPLATESSVGSSADDIQARLTNGFVPSTFSCRDSQVSTIRSCVRKAADSRKGCAMYLSGLPGTGKTATARHAFADCDEEAALGDRVKLLWLNCMVLDGKNGLYCELDRQVERIVASSRHERGAAKVSKLKRVFSRPPPDSDMWVVVCDEVDALLGRVGGKSAKANPAREAIDTLLEWSAAPHSHLSLVTISNDMQLLKLLTATHQRSITSLHFPSYGWQELVDIVQNRICDLDEKRIQKRALEFCAKKVASSNGDCRKMLNMVRMLVAGQEQRRPPVTPDSAPLRRPTVTPETAPLRRPSLEASPSKRFRLSPPQAVKPPSTPLFSPKTCSSVGSPDMLAPVSPPSVVSPDVLSSASTPLPAAIARLQQPPEPPISPMEPKALFSPVGLKEAAQLFNTQATALALQLTRLPEKQKLLLVAAFKMCRKQETTFGRWMEYHKELCQAQKLPNLSEGEMLELAEGLANFGIVELKRQTKAGASKRLMKVYVRVTEQDLRHAFGNQPVVLSILDTKCVGLKAYALTS